MVYSVPEFETWIPKLVWLEFLSRGDTNSGDVVSDLGDRVKLT